MNSSEPIAVVGMSCLFPNSPSLSEYWDLITKGRDAITDIPMTHWRASDYFDSDPKTPDHTYVKRGGFLKPYRFNPLKFGLSPHAIEATDTTQIFGMVSALEALEDAGYADEKAFDRDRVSCILGVTGTLELVIPLGARLGHPIWKKALQKAGVDDQTAKSIMDDIAASYVPWQEASFPGLLGNVVAGRIANRLNLGGTNAVVDAACASSLGALQNAVLELRSGKSDMVITGGMDTFNDIFMYMCFSKTPAHSPSQDVRPFDANGDGTILGEGIGTIVLKRLSDAERDSDRIYAVIKGIGSSSDGRGKSIYAPSAKGQIKALKHAYEDANVDPSSVGLIECHGTGTRVGDGVELSALTELFTQSHPLTGNMKTAIGSVKSQIGHTKAAAGAAGIIKATLALHNKVLPPSIKISEPHPHLKDSPFEVHDKARPWVTNGSPRRAGVSAFGFGGSNFHCVLEEYNAQKYNTDLAFWPKPLVMTATNIEGLKSELSDLVFSVTGEDDTEKKRYLFCKALEKGFESDPYAKERLVITCESVEDGIDTLIKVSEAFSKLDTNAQNHTPLSIKGVVWSGERKNSGLLAYIFPGQGAQYVDMMRELSIRFPEMLESSQSLATAWASSHPNGPLALTNAIWPTGAYSAAEKESQKLELKRTDFAQPALASVCSGLVDILNRFKLRPDVYGGHSFGELSAMYAAGMLNREDLFKLAIARGQIMADVSGKYKGEMLAVKSDRQSVEQILKELSLPLTLANDNAPNQVVVSGEGVHIEALKSALSERRISSTKLNVATAFHSPIVSSAVEPFSKIVEGVKVEPGQGLVYANLTAKPYSDEGVAQVLGQQIASPVRFVEMIEDMLLSGVRCFLEVGPKKTMSGLIRSIAKAKKIEVDIIHTDNGSDDKGWSCLLNALSSLFCLGYGIDWSPLKGSLEPRLLRKPEDYFVSITGANYRQLRETEDETNPVVFSSKPVMNKSEKSIVKSINLSGASMNSDQTKDQNAKSVMEKQIDALLEMQRETARLHKQYLDQQLQSQSVLADMWRDYKALTGASNLDYNGQQETRVKKLEEQKVMDATQSVTNPLKDEVASVKSSGHGTQSLRERVQEAMQAKKNLDEKASQENLNPSSALVDTVTKNQAPGPSPLVGTDSSLNQGVIAVIAEKTGYPEAMIEPSMELEGDLGIDSIKKVEILSSLQETMPELEQTMNDLSSNIVSVGDIFKLIESPGSSKFQPQNAVGLVQEKSKEPVGQDELLSRIYKVISEKTGYPESMLEPSLELEADLGIDSIKRVEIASELSDGNGQISGDINEKLSAAVSIAEVLSVLAAKPLSEQGKPSIDATAVSSDESSHLMAKSDANKTDRLFAIISEKTGYPIDLLNPEMRFEEDLGIDSIKKVEIISALSEEFNDLHDADQDKFNSVETIAGLISLIDSTQHSKTASDLQSSPETLPQTKSAINTVSRAVEGASAAHDGSSSEHSQSDHDRPKQPVIDGQVEAKQAIYLKRMELSHHFVEALENKEINLAPGGRVWVTDDGSNLARNIVLKLREKGLKPRLISIAFADRMKAPEALEGLILLTPLKLDGSPTRFLANTFKLVKMVAPALQKTPAEGCQHLFSVVTRNGGFFGTKGLEEKSAIYGASVFGFAKTAQREWDNVTVKAIDLGKDFKDGFEATSRLFDAMFNQTQGEIGVFKKGYALPELKELAQESGLDLTKPLVEQNQSILVTGGARGVTWSFVETMAKAQKTARIVIWGRTSLTDPGFDEKAYAAYETKTQLIQALGESQHLESGKLSPSELKDKAQQILKVREINTNLMKLRRLGFDVLYQSVDVSQESEVLAALVDLEGKEHKIGAVIHGAGVLKDRFISDLSEDDFIEVLDTKIRLLPHLERPLFDKLSCAVFFSSSTGRFGRKGQVAYAVANEVLNKFTQYYRLKKPEAKVLAVNWGPWNGGMVDDSLKAVFAAEGIASIPLQLGSEFLWQELVSKRGFNGELVVLAEHGKAVSKGDTKEPGVFTISPASFPILRHHMIKHQYVLPVVLHLELMIKKAMDENPSLHFAGLYDFRVLRGIKLAATDELQVKVDLEGVKAVDNGLKVTASLCALDSASKDWYKSSSAEILIVENPLQVPSPSINVQFESCTMDVADLYQKYLFHGKRLQGIEAVDAYTKDEGISGLVQTQQRPGMWLQEPQLENWFTNPLAIDSSFQLGVIWSSLSRSLRSLPVGLHSYQQFKNFTENDFYQVRFKVNQQKEQSFEADIEFLDESGHVVALMKGYQAIMDESLADSFKPLSVQVEVDSQV